jgi:hypothetical protein
MTNTNSVSISNGSLAGSLTTNGIGVQGIGSSSGVGIYGTSGSGSIQIGNGSLSASPYIFQQSSPYYFSTPAPDKYAVFKLPHELLPEAIFVCGRMVTVGALGTDVECAYAGDTLIFSPGVLTAICFNNKVTIILQYADRMYHYGVSYTYGTINYKPDAPRIIEATLLSQTKRGQKTE